MTDDNAAAVSSPVVCEIILGGSLEDHVDQFRTFVDTLGDLTCAALRTSGAIESSDELFDRNRWDGAVSTGEVLAGTAKTRRLTRRSWTDALRAPALRGFGVSLRPLPTTPEVETGSTVSLESSWYDGPKNWVAVQWPLRFVDQAGEPWLRSLVEAFTAFGREANAILGTLGRLPPGGFLRYPWIHLDYSRQVYAPGWGMLLTEAHVDLLGGTTVLNGSGLFSQVRRINGAQHALVYVERARDLFEAGGEWDTRLAEFLAPVLLPPPYSD